MNPLLLTLKKKLILSVLSLGLILVSALVSAAQSADVANRALLGFSPEGRYFAMEEYGVQDGSGFPYSTIYIIETKKNSWVKGSPFRALIKDETASLQQAREQAAGLAKDFLEKHDIKHPGQLLAHNPVTELGTQRDFVMVAPGAAPFLTKHALAFSVAPVPLPTKRCQDYGPESQQGYALSLKRVGGRPGAPPQLLYKDKRIPTSRGCPKRYAISDVVRFVKTADAKEALYIIILQVFTYGFEGDDGRYLVSGHWMPSFLAPSSKQ